MRISDWSSDVCSSDRVLGPAVAAAVVGPVLHEQTRDRLAGIAQQQRGHGGIDAAGHANHDPCVHGTCRSSDSGWRWPERKSATTRHTSGLRWRRSEEHTSELQSLMRNSYAVFCLQKKTPK